MTRQFLSADPLLAAPGTPGGTSAYTYAWHDPVNFVDPTGMRPISMEEWEVLRTREEQGTLGAAAEALRADPFGSLLAVGVVVAGAAMLATPAAAIGMGVLVGAGLTAGVGLATGTFDPWSVAIGGVIGGCSVGAANALTPARQVAADALVGAAESGLQQVATGEFDPIGLVVGTATSGATGLVGVPFGSLTTTGTRTFVVDGSLDVASSVVQQGLTGGGWSVGVANWADGVLGGSLGAASRRTGPWGRSDAALVPAWPEPGLRLEVGPIAPSAGPTPEMLTVYATVSAAELAVHGETGLVLVDPARSSSPSAYRVGVEQWGSEADLLEVERLFGVDIGTDVPIRSQPW